jgi:tripartite-type tricarboxylate transporter receptor subunit TctC
LAAAALAGGLPRVAGANMWPDRPVRLIVPFAPGGSLDILGRFLANAVQLGQPIVVENRSGAGGNIGFDASAKAPADGYTLMLASEPLTVNPALMRVGFDPVQDFTGISLVATLTQVLVVHPSVPAADLAALVALAKAKPDSINVASAGPGTSGHLAIAMMASAGVPLVHVPFRGGGPAAAAVLSGQVQAGIMTLPAALGYIRQGQLKAFGVTASRRSIFLPDVPTISELVPEAVVDSWQALFAPTGTPPAIIERIHAATVKALDTSDAATFLERQGFEKVGSSPATLNDLLRSEAAKWPAVVKQTGVTAGG